MSYPAKLQQIIDLFEVLPEEEKRETLIAYADQASAQAPREGETFSLEDVRKDEECTDTVGVFLSVDPDRKVRFRITLGPQVQTLTRAMTAILCKGFEGASIEEVMEVPADFVPKIVGAKKERPRISFISASCSCPQPPPPSAGVRWQAHRPCFFTSCFSGAMMVISASFFVL